MPSRWTCPRGHQWESGDTEFITAHAPPACPVCANLAGDEFATQRPPAADPWAARAAETPRDPWATRSPDSPGAARRDLPESLYLAHEVDALCDRYEKALRRGEVGPLDGWLPVADRARAAALVELARLELEHRLRAGEHVGVEDYFARYPELRADAAGAARLLATERGGRRTRS